MEKMRSKYAKFFGPGHPFWSKNYSENIMFLKTYEIYCNQLLICDRCMIGGWLRLGEVYKILGFKDHAKDYIVGYKSPGGIVAFDIEEVEGEGFWIDFNNLEVIDDSIQALN